MALILDGTNGLSDVDGTAGTPAIRGSDANTGVFFGTDIVGVSTGGSERVRVDASGNVGIGTSSPGQKLTIQGPSNQAFLLAQDSTGGTQGIYGADSVAGGAVLGSLSNHPAIFRTNNTERMRIDSSGNLLVGTTSSNYHTLVKNNNGDWAAMVQNTSASPYGQYILYPNAAPNTSFNEFLYCADSSSARITLRSNGGIANFQANNANLSDRREKTNFAPAKSYLETICAIPVQTFNYIDQNHEEDPGLTLGVVAQDVQEVAPELVMESNWGTKEEPKMRLSIYQTDLQYALMKCIQEQQAIIQSLTARIEALENQT